MEDSKRGTGELNLPASDVDPVSKLTSGKPADENLPEVVIDPSTEKQHIGTTTSAFDHSPEVLSPNDAATHTYFTERDKYPAHFDDAPKLPYDGQQWPSSDPVSALSPNSVNAMPWETLPPAGETSPSNVEAGEKDQEKRICGMRRRNFIIIIVVVLVVIIAAAVGGGVGASRANSGSHDTSSAAAESGASTSTTINPTTTAPTSTTSQSSTSSTTSSILPSQTIEFLNNQTGSVGLAFQGFEEQDYLGRNTSIIRKEGYYDFPFPCKSYVWLPNAPECCVTFCANKTTAVGWRCDKRYRPRTDDGSGFPRISIWCDRANSDKYSEKCS
ncbi:hypothetical protein V8F20_009950 [Naviculisporaceae sp. PSN 640]